MHASCLRRLGASVAPPQRRSFRGVGVDVGPLVALSPSFAPCFSLLALRLPAPSAIAISQRSSLVVSGDVTIRALDLDGALVLRAPAGASVLVKALKVRNDGWALVELDDAEQADAAVPEITRIRGYTLQRRATRAIAAREGEALVVDEPDGADGACSML